MSNTQANRYQAVAKVLLAAQEQINVLLVGPDDELHRLKLNQSLQRDADYIVLVTGAGDVHQVQSTVLGPATTIGGKPIGKGPKFTEADLVPSDDKVFNLKLQVEAAMDYFGPDADSAGILANIPDIVIRGVAKKAGFKEITKDNPKEITVEFIDQVKEALHANTQQPNSETIPTVEQIPGGISEQNSIATSSTEETRPSKTAESDTVKAVDIAELKPELKKGKPGK